jgi:ubiquinol-cytochrome c reductase iron-sulfur subunit
MATTMNETEDGATRRDFIHIAATAFVGIGAAAALWPAVDQMNPDASALALATTDVDLSPIQPGQAITVMWRGKPVFVRNRTDDEVKAVKAVPLSQLIDQDARVLEAKTTLTATDENRTKKGKENWLVVIGVCTHLGCVPKGQAPSDDRGEYNGWSCPCHGSLYDASGRVRRSPAPRNLDVPPYEFTSDTKIKIG